MRSLRLVGAMVASLAVLTSCGGNDAKSEGPTSPATSPSTTAPAPSVTSSTPSRPAVKTRTAADLKKALVALGDLPAGFSVEPDGSDDGDVDMTSKDPRCAALARLMNADTAPGSKGTATRSFSGGQEGPFIDESLDAMGSAAAVAALQKTFRAAVASCSRLTLSIPGEGRSTVSVRQISAPKQGTGPFAVRFTATGGPLDGLEVSLVTTGIDDVVLGMTFVAAVPEDVDGATGVAVDKAKSVLIGTKSGT